MSRHIRFAQCKRDAPMRDGKRAIWNLREGEKQMSRHIRFAQCERDAPMRDGKRAI